MRGRERPDADARPSLYAAGEPAFIEDLANDNRFHSLQREGAVSAIFVPIRAGSGLLGNILLGLRSPRPVSADEIRLLTTLGNQIGIAAQKAELYENMRKAETQRAEAEAHLRQAQKMEAVGNLAGGVAHDFNNLLTAIIGFGEMALDADAPPDDVRTYVQEMVKAGERAAVLTRQLLAFSRRQVLRPEVIDLNVVVENMDRLLQRVIGEDIDLQTRLHPGLGHTRADPGQIEQVLLNLAVNARDAMADGGQLSIQTSNCTLDGMYADQHAEVTPGPYVQIAVTDTGHGIPPEVLARIFEPFFTTKEQGKGTGLGLATVYGIVKQSGGHLSVYSEVGIGTTFRIYLPQVDEQATLEAPATSVQLERAAAGGTILLVEDELGVRALARVVLDTAGYSVLEAATPEEALQIVERLSRPVDLMITDVVMPGMNGPALAALVRERWPGTRVIFMSGYPGDPLRRQGAIAADAPYLEKPFTPKALRTKVSEVLEPQS
jgi:two-component system, cell cycle sensor histidine kinase and response regulator CckA